MVNYLLKESPDSISIDGEWISYRRDDVVSFIMLENGFTIYSATNMDDDFYGHHGLKSAFLDSLKPEPTNVAEDAWEKSKREQNIRYAHKYVKTLGETALDYYALNVRLDDRYANTLYGRFWKDAKALSWWGFNHPLIKQKPIRLQIIKLLEKNGQNPIEYKFEVGENFVNLVKFLNYGSEQENKEYELKGKLYTTADLNTLRVNLHLSSGIEKDRAFSTLCDIIDDETLEKYPELQGFRPPDCSKLVRDTGKDYEKLRKVGRLDMQSGIGRSIRPDRRGMPSSRELKGVVSGVGDEAGKVSGMPFRARTQKELDRAWDLAQKRGGGFKEWLMVLESYFTI